MICEKCKANMTKVIKDSIQGWACSNCGWSMLTTYIDKIYEDDTEYSIFIINVKNIDEDKIKLIAKICGVNFVVARQMLLKDNVCILKAKAPEVRAVIGQLEKYNIQFDICPRFNY